MLTGSAIFAQLTAESPDTLQWALLTNLVKKNFQTLSTKLSPPSIKEIVRFFLLDCHSFFLSEGLLRKFWTFSHEVWQGIHLNTGKPNNFWMVHKNPTVNGIAMKGPPSGAICEYHCNLQMTLASRHL